MCIAFCTTLPGVPQQIFRVCRFFLPTKKPKLGELGFGSKTRDQELAVLCVPSC